MNRQEILDGIKNKFKEEIIDYFDKYEKRVFIEIKKEALIPVATYIFKDLKARFNIATGTDLRYHMEILYHFTLEDINLMVSVRVKLPKDQPLEIDSLTSSFRGSDWIEREIHEMLGINFIGHPNLKRLLLADDWPEDVHPLRCDYQEWDKKAVRDRGV